MKFLFSIVILILSTQIQAQSGSWIPVQPAPGDTITLICDPSLDPEADGMDISSMTLYWGINGVPGAWQEPPQSIWPAGTVSEGNNQAVQSPMQKVGNTWQIQLITNENVSKLLFLFRPNGTQFLRDNGQDYQLRLLAGNEAVQYVDIIDNTIWIYGQSVTLNLTPVRNNIIRLGYNDSLFQHTVMMDSLDFSLPFLTYNETDTSIVAGMSDISVQVSKANMSVTIYNGDGQAVLYPGDSPTFVQSGPSQGFAFQSNATGIHGLGEKGTSINRIGQRFDSYNRANYGYNGALATMKINIPFIMTNSGVGLFVDNQWPAEIDFRNGLTFLAESGPFVYYAIAGSKQDQLTGFHVLTGFPPLLPKWAFGYFQSKYGYENAQEVRNVANTFRSKRIPADVIILDLYWFGNPSTMGDLDWDLTRFPDPVGLINEMRSKGFGIIPIQETYLVNGTRLEQIASSNGWVGKDNEGNPMTLNGFWAGNAKLLDITHPDAQAFWWQQTKAITDDGIVGWWTDLGEPENHPDDMVHVSGPARKVHNVYNLIWAQTLFEGFENDYPDKRFFNLTRSGTAGMQRYATAPWSGDVSRTFSGLSLQMPIMLGMTMSGQSFMHSDLGGFAGPATTSELYIRWMQMGAFAGIMRAHSSFQNQEPWAFGQQAENITSTFIKHRYQLFPYLYTQAYRYSTDGFPIIRPLHFQYPDHETLNDYDQAFLIGSDIMVAPVLSENARHKEIYLPGGAWYDYLNDPLPENAITGEGFFNYEAPLETIPIFIRSGSIIPTTTLRRNLAEQTLDTVYWTIYPDQEIDYAEGYMVEDDGISLKWKKGEFLDHHVTYTGDFNVLQPFSINVSVNGQAYDGMAESRLSYFYLYTQSWLASFVIVDQDTLLLTDPEVFDTTTGSSYTFDQSAMKIKVRHHPTENFNISGILSRSVTVNQPPVISKFKLEPAFPNPFNPTTTLRYSIPADGQVNISVYNSLGQLISELRNEFMTSGDYHQQINANHWPSGTYFVRLAHPEGIKVQPILLVK